MVAFGCLWLSPDFSVFENFNFWKIPRAWRLGLRVLLYITMPWFPQLMASRKKNSTTHSTSTCTCTVKTLQHRPACVVLFWTLQVHVLVMFWTLQLYSTCTVPIPDNK